MSNCPFHPPKPPVREGRASFWRYLKLVRADLLSAHPAKLYRAWMAEFRTPFFRSYLCNDPDLVDLVLKRRPRDFPKSNRLREGLSVLLRNSVFITNGDEWEAQRRIIDPAFEGGRLRQTFPAMWDATLAAIDRLRSRTGTLDIEPETSHAAADIIFRTLFSIPIQHDIASAMFDAFRRHQRAVPIVNVAALLTLPRWIPRPHSRATRKTSAEIRDLITRLTAERMQAIRAGTAPDDLATKIMTTPDPQTGRCFDTEDMVDQVAIFFLAGHETSASALAWALWLVAAAPEWQDKLAGEARREIDDSAPDVAMVGRLKVARAVFREALRLYPPVPMMVRETVQPERLRGRDVPPGAQIVLSAWHLHRHERLWDDPDAFDPSRFETENGKDGLKRAYIPFSAGPRVCTGAGFAMIEGPLLLAMIAREFRIEVVPDKTPMPVAYLTVRGKDGIWLKISPRA